VTTTDTVSEAPAATAPVIAPAEGNLASLIIGESVYNGTGDEAQDIGKVNDVVLSPEGKAQSLVIGVGGFLGMGQKNVAFDFDKATWAERDGDRWLVVEATKESLEALPDFDRRAYDVAPVTSADNSAAAPAAVPATDTAAAPKEQPDATSTAAIDKSTLTEVQMTDVSAKELDGTTVYGADDVKVGEIGDAVLTPDGQVDAVIIDVGGFLGIGSKPVAVGMDTFRVMADKDGKKYLYTEFTKEQLEAHPAYDKDSYADNREQQRLMVR
jgi:sporulation protein YlmC with PRC-barrel domain